MKGARKYKNRINGMCNEEINVSSEDIINGFKGISNEENSDSLFDIFDDSAVMNPEFEIMDLSDDKFEVSASGDSKNLSKELSDISDAIARKTAKTDVFATTLKKNRRFFGIGACVIAAIFIAAAGIKYRKEIFAVADNFLGRNSISEYEDMKYLYEIGEAKNANGCTINLLGVSGSYSDPVINCDILFEGNDRGKMENVIDVEAYILGKEQFENEKDRYSTFSGQGIQDEFTSGLYHVSFEVPQIWLTDEKPVILNFTEITYTEVINRTITPKAEFEFVVPNEYFHDSKTVYVDDVSVEYKDASYKLTEISYSEYNTKLLFEYDLKNDEYKTEKEQKKYEKKLSNNANKMLNKSYLYVDGEKHECECIFDKTNEENPNKGYKIVEFNVGDTDYSSDFYLNVCDMTFNLDRPKKMLSYEEYVTRLPENCEEIAKKGYTYECNSFVDDENFKVTLVRVFGDRYLPIMQFDVEFKNPDEALFQDEIGMAVRLVPSRNYDKRDNYIETMFTGIRDDENPALYHLIGSGDIDCVGDGKKSVAIIDYIYPIEGDDPYFVYDTDLGLINIHTPEMFLKDTSNINVGINDINIDGTDYSFSVEADTGLSTICEIAFEIPEEIRETNESEKYEYCQKMMWNFINKASLIADDKEYFVQPMMDEHLDIYIDDEICSVIVDYEPIYFYMCDEVTLVIEDTTYLMRMGK